MNRLLKAKAKYSSDDNHLKFGNPEVEVSDQFLIQPDGSVIFIAAFVSPVTDMEQFMAAEVREFDALVKKNTEDS